MQGDNEMRQIATIPAIERLNGSECVSPSSYVIYKDPKAERNTYVVKYEYYDFTLHEYPTRRSKTIAKYTDYESCIWDIAQRILCPGRILMVL